jgi:hypothetical protein
VTSAAAQESAGSIRGKIVDSSGAVLPGVTIHLSSFGESVRETTTDERGLYVFEPLPSSMYTLTAELPGFVKASRSIALAAHEAGRVDLTMAVGLMFTDCPPWHWLGSVSAGYVVTHQSNVGSNLPAGWVVDFAGGRFLGGFQWVGEASGSYRTSGDRDTSTPTNIFSALVGSRQTAIGIGRFSVSGQLLGGVARIKESSTRLETITYAFTVQPGVAVEHRANRDFRLRGEVDVRFFVIASGGHPAAHDYRLAVSLVRTIPRWICL